MFTKLHVHNVTKISFESHVTFLGGERTNKKKLGSNLSQVFAHWVCLTLKSLVEGPALLTRWQTKRDGGVRAPETRDCWKSPAKQQGPPVEMSLDSATAQDSQFFERGGHA